MPEEGWTPLAWRAQRDYALSWRARGLLSELLSYPDGWNTTIDDLVDRAKRLGGGACEGRKAMRRAMAELAELGYVRYERSQDKRGRWVTEMVVSDAPMPKPQGRGRNRADASTDVPLSDTSVDRHVGEPDGRHTDTSENWPVNRKTDDKTVAKTDLQRLSDQHSRALASLASAAGAANDDHRERALNEMYKTIDQMPTDARRHALLAVERKRPQVYRQARNKAINQLQHEEPEALAGKPAAPNVDALSLKYLAQHYSAGWPQWFLRLVSRSP